ncbi:MAG: hypothetical protein QOD06_2124 [Candidatus Binatota bacterium]|jgi:hypothetical protein|nr:hypothetical protein [Candidatus Binatota bacterium]
MPIARSNGAYQTVSSGMIVYGGTNVVELLATKSKERLTGFNDSSDAGAVKSCRIISPIAPPFCLRKFRRTVLP